MSSKKTRRHVVTVTIALTSTVRKILEESGFSIKGVDRTPTETSFIVATKATIKPEDIQDTVWKTHPTIWCSVRSV